MLLRRRAWDILREDYPVVRIDDPLAEAIRKLNACASEGCLCALVEDRNGRLKGAVSIWDTMRFMEDSLLHGEGMKCLDENRYEQMFTNACKISGSISVKDLMDKDMTIIRPDEPLLLVLEDFVKKGRSYAVVMESSRVIGVIMIQDIYKEISDQILARS